MSKIYLMEGHRTFNIIYGNDSFVLSMSDKFIYARVIMDMKIFISHHCTTLVPLSFADDMHMTDTKCVGATDYGSHIKITLKIFHRYLKPHAIFIKTRDDIIHGLAFVDIDKITGIVHLLIHCNKKRTARVH